MNGNSDYRRASHETPTRLQHLHNRQQHYHPREKQQQRERERECEKSNGIFSLLSYRPVTSDRHSTIKRLDSPRGNALQHLVLSPLHTPREGIPQQTVKRSLLGTSSSSYSSFSQRLSELSSPLSVPPTLQRQSHKSTQQQKSLISSLPPHTTTLTVNTNGNNRNCVVPISKQQPCTVSLLYSSYMAADLMDWKMKRRHDDIGAMVELLSLLMDREKENRLFILQEEAERRRTLQFIEMDERGAASFYSNALSAALSSLSISLGRRRRSTDIMYMPQMQNNCFDLKSHATATSITTSSTTKRDPSWRNVNKRRNIMDEYDSDEFVRTSSVSAVMSDADRKLMLSDEELASRELITIVEEGRRSLLLNDPNVNACSLNSGSHLSGRTDSDERDDNNKNNNSDDYDNDDDDDGDMGKFFIGTSQPKWLSQGTNNAHDNYDYDDDEEEEEIGRRQDETETDEQSERKDNCSSQGFMADPDVYQRYWEDRWVSGTPEQPEYTAPTAIPREELLQWRDASREQEQQEQLNRQSLILRDEFDMDSFRLAEEERLKALLEDLLLEERRSREALLLLQASDASRLAEQSAALWHSRRVQDVIARWSDNVVREEEAARRRICGDFEYQQSGLASEVQSPLTPHRVRVGSERRERHAICSAFCEGIYAAMTAAVEAVMEEEREERLRLERAAQPKYTQILWEMELMGERQELLLEEMSARKAVEYNEVGQWMDLRVLRDLQRNQLLHTREQSTSSNVGVGVGVGGSVERVREMNVQSHESSSHSGFVFGSVSSQSTISGQIEYETDSTFSSPSIEMENDDIVPFNKSHNWQGTTLSLSPYSPYTPMVTAAKRGRGENVMASIEREERKERDAIFATWLRGFDNLMELDVMGTEELKRTIFFCNAITRSRVRSN
ncbi:uncharacterized protein TM35_000051570 [Trypanosoma theileri]|uniref:Uncharacterized protein n=1 Tax=Trypanosoma theileri TaxID=67003 RepID=A0A1X0P3Z5_9TRYP|nr:uncharacterized protein TM35_000051570 [Trypanosoma theileri]ORC91561.1 hypothetical protein TM35_000051570 [Trypanosoma theileri]